MLDEIRRLFDRAHEGRVLDVMTPLRNTAIDKLKTTLGLDGLLVQPVTRVETFNPHWHPVDLAHHVYSVIERAHDARC